MPRKKNKRLNRSLSFPQPQKSNSMPSEALPSHSHESDPNPVHYEEEEGEEAVANVGPERDGENAEPEPDTESDSESQAAISTQESNPIPAIDSNPSPLLRRKGKRKRQSRKQKDTVEKKLRLLRQNLCLVPFKPSKTLDFSKHEDFLKALGLWDFALLDLGAETPRRDLLVALFANYDAGLRCSYVHDQRINVNRSYLSRALRLPVKKERQDFRAEAVPPEEEAFSFLSQFVENYMLLHEDDAWIMPEEVMEWERLLKEGQFHKVDWAWLIWFMVEKELVQVPESGNCYYAAHLQCLIRSQKPDLFKEDEEVEEISADAREEVGVVKDEHLDESRKDCDQNERIELCLGQGNGESKRPAEDTGMDFQGCGKEVGQWFLSERSIGLDHSLRHCNLELGNSECERVEEIEEERHGQPLKFSKLERLQSAEFDQEMKTGNDAYGVSTNIIDPSSSDFLMDRADLHKSLLNESSLPIFGNACKRDINEEEAIHTIPHFDQDRKMKTNGPWDNAVEGFGTCLEQALNWVNRARMMHEDKEEAYARAQMHVDYLVTELQQRDSIIHSMEKSVMEERSKRQVEFYRLERELCVLTQLAHGYKKALKETRKAFAEYRGKVQHHSEPIYKDVGGDGGLVLSIMELEKQRLRKEEEMRKICGAIEEKVKTFEMDWLVKFNSYDNKVDLLTKKVAKIMEQVGHLKENHKLEHLTT